MTQVKIHPRTTLKNKQLGVIVRTIGLLDGTYSAYVECGGSCQPRIVRNGRPNREAAIKSVLRAIDATWCDHAAQAILDRNSIQLPWPIQRTLANYKLWLETETGFIVPEHVQLVDEVVDRYSDNDMALTEESIDYEWRCDSAWVNDCQLSDGNDDCSCDTCEDVNGYRVSRTVSR